MKESKILNAIPQLRNLDEEKVDFILKAVNSCALVQQLESLENLTDIDQIDGLLGSNKKSLIN
jgi:hypothetical protein